MKAKFAILFCITSLIFLSGCSPAGKLKRANRLIEKAEQAGAKWSVDTVFITKEVIVPERHIDTVLSYRNLTDTITVEKEKVITKVKFDIKTHTVYVHTDCPPDTLKIEVPVTVTKEIKAGASTWDIIKICILVAVVSILLTRLFWK